MGNLLFVKPGSGVNYQNLVSDWLAETKGQERHLIVFPEGECGNRKALLPFRTGVFRPGVPVQPVLIRYLQLQQAFLKLTLTMHHFPARIIFYIAKILEFPPPQKIESLKRY